MKIAIIGSGIAGLTAAWRLHRHHDIEIFEANNHIGGHTNTADVHYQGIDYAIDTGFIVFNKRTYPNFIALLKELNVDYQPSDMGFAVSSQRSGLEYSGSSLNAVFSQRRNLVNTSFYKLLIGILKFNRRAPAFLKHANRDFSLGDYLNRYHYPQPFIDNYIIPMGAAIWSTDPEKMLEFPAETFIRFFKNHGLLSVSNQPQWYVIKGGSKEYVSKLIAPFRDAIHTNTPVEKIIRQPDHVDIITASGKQRFDVVFIATHSDQTLAMLEEPSAQERRILGAIKYQHNEAVLHTDTSLLPKNKRAWAAWNCFIPASGDRVMLTYNMNILQNLQAPCEFCVTLNNSAAIDPDSIVKRIDYSHPVFDRASIDAQKNWGDISGTNRTYYCGAYWGYGFHEDGVNSAIRATDLFFEQQGAADISNEKAAFRAA
jgi:predicted NAD/FAD-binding protein